MANPPFTGRLQAASRDGGAAGGGHASAGGPVGQEPGALVHDAVLYRGVEELLAGTVPFVTGGLAAGEPVLVAAPPPTLASLQAAMPGLDGRVRMVDIREAGRNPGRILPGVLLAFAGAHPRHRVRMLVEPVWAGRSEAEYPGCVQHEALINQVFAGRRVAVRCPYDAEALAAGWLEDAERTHPWLGSGARAAASGRYEDPLATVAAFNAPLPSPPPAAERLVVDLGRLGDLRQLVAERAAEAGLAAGRVADLTIAVNELATNSIKHAGTPGTVAVWVTERAVVCQVRDGGHIVDPLAGRVPPAADAAGGGRGLVVVNELCDLVRTYTRPGCTVVEIHMRR